MKNKIEFQPVVIGTDLNAYNVARAFHMEYGVTSKIFGRKKLLMVDHSRICDVTEVDDFDKDEIMVETLVNYAKSNQSRKLILFAASEQYVHRIFSSYDILKAHYLIPYTSPEQGITLSDKMNFYSYCEKHDLPYPSAEVISRSDYESFSTNIGFPLILKPIESSDYFDLQFEGKEKVYILKDEAELKNALEKIYAHGYGHDMLIQEYVHGDVTNEYVMNVYSDSNGKVRLMSLGRILIEDPQPDMRGNYVAIISPPETPLIQELYDDVKRFLEAIAFTGISNFDLKFDEKDGKFKFFEINMRQGRSSFFSVLSGANYAVPIVENLIEGKDNDNIVYGTEPFVWINCTTDMFMKITKDHREEFYDEVSSIKNIDNTLFYKNDLSILRKMKLNKYLNLYDERLMKYFEKRK